MQRSYQFCDFVQRNEKEQVECEERASSRRIFFCDANAKMNTNSLYGPCMDDHDEQTWRNDFLCSHTSIFRIPVRKLLIRQA